MDRAIVHPIDTFAPIALHVILALIAGVLIGSAWESWQVHRRRRKANPERTLLDTLRWLYGRRSL